MGNTGEQGFKNRDKMSIEHSQQFLKRRKFLTVVPLIVVPFMTVVFWLLGGGRGGVVATAAVKPGLNTQLPDAITKTSSVLDKMSFYAMADKDSLKRSEQERMDPNYTDAVAEKTSGASRKLNISIGPPKPDHTEEEINRKLKELRARMNEPEVRKPLSPVVEVDEPVQSVATRRVDPEMQEINNTLEKLLDVQHPERVKERLVEKKGTVYSVSVNSEGSDGDFFGGGDSTRSSFYSSGNVAANAPGVISAVIHGSQVLQNGFIVKMRLLKDVFVNGSKIPAGSFVYGTAAINEERLKVLVSSIQFEKNLFPVALHVYDMDGLEGIYIPGSAAREVVKQVGDQSLQSLGIVSMDQSLKAQAAAAGIGAAKSLLSKKVKQVRVTVKSNYMVLLKDANAK
jgi:conjugative transposon TraM protein